MREGPRQRGLPASGCLRVHPVTPPLRIAARRARLVLCTRQSHASGARAALCSAQDGVPGCTEGVLQFAEPCPGAWKALCKLQDGIPGGWKAFCKLQSHVPGVWTTSCKLQDHIPWSWEGVLQTAGRHPGTWEGVLQSAERCASNMDHTLQAAEDHPAHMGRHSAARRGRRQQHGSHAAERRLASWERRGRPAVRSQPVCGSRFSHGHRRRRRGLPGRALAGVPCRSMNIRLLAGRLQACVISCWRCSCSSGARPGLIRPSLSRQQMATGALPPRRGSSRSIVGTRAASPCG